MLEKLKQKDIRWEILQNDQGRANNRLYRSLFNYMTKKIGGEEEDKTVSDHGGESASSKDSPKTLSVLGKRNKPEQLIVTPKNSPKGQQDSPIFHKESQGKPNDSKETIL